MINTTDTIHIGSRLGSVLIRLKEKETSVNRMLLILMIAGLVAQAGYGTEDVSEPSPGLYPNLGSYHRNVTTNSTKAQQYFDQGLVLYYGFNHDEAIRFFEIARTLDPGFAMAYWGIALAAGPNINNMDMTEEACRKAHDAVTHAVTLGDQGTAVERDLITALSHRYAWPPPEDRNSLNNDYAEAMRKVWLAHPDDPDVGALFAESMMDLRPWDLWTPDGEPQPGTGEIIATLEKVIAVAPDHPGANHFYIHTMEASPFPERALPSADTLRNLVPDAGHLVHMPSHIDIRIGHYDKAILANQKAIDADRRYVDRAGRGGFYTLYRAHNFHFLAYAAMFDGRRELAMKAAREMVAEIPLDLVREFPDFLDGFIAVPVHVMVRFGLWEELLKEPRPPEDLMATTAFWHYGRTVALSSLGRVDEATREFAALEKSASQVPESRLIGNNTAQVVLDIAIAMAEGELEYRRGHFDRAFELLREAIRRDDALLYDEPRGWMQPVRHALGALLLEQGRAEEAETVYRKDLEHNPGNGWALNGLAECLRRENRDREADVVDAAFRAAWDRSDIIIHASCYCRTGK